MSTLGHRITRRVFVARLAGSAVALGLVVLAAPRATMARAHERSASAIPVRLGEIVQTGVDFRGGLAEGVRLPRAGGDSWALTAERPGGRFTSEPLRLDFPSSHVGVHWRTDGPASGLGVEVRSSRDGQRWSSWRRVQAETHGRDDARDETFGALVAGRLGTWLQYRLTFGEASGGEREMAAVERVALTYLDARGPADRGGPIPTGQAAGQTGFKGGKDAFLARVIPREAWGADESIRFAEGRDQWPRAFVTPKLLVVHHTATENEYDDPAAEIRAIYTYHTVTQGFGDIGYNLLIDDRGQAYEGRLGREADPMGGLDREVLSRDVVAGHAYGYNWGSVGIAVLGTFGALSADDPRSLAAAEPSVTALMTLEEALAFVAARHGLDPTERMAFLRARSPSGDDALWRDDLAAISGHRDCVPTECPGERLYARLPELRERVAARLGPPGPRARITRGPE
ncbi:MAG: N-acetylmuramoyl-L-alanine amidase, partial [Chloroflexi bacterium]|nr:N-acetylmuramoyl-L-alanine amidase [Chloroflexota bacterium]